MKGIPKMFNTKQDLLNVHYMALRGTIDRKEWKKVLEELAQEVKFSIPVIDKGPDYIVIPKTEKEIPASYGTVVSDSIDDHKGNTIWQTMKIYTAEPDSIDSVIIGGGYPKLDYIGMKVEDILKLIREIK